MPKDLEKLRRQMARRGWTDAQITEARAGGQMVKTVNQETGGPATRYIHPHSSADGPIGRIR